MSKRDVLLAILNFGELKSLANNAKIRSSLKLHLYGNTPSLDNHALLQTHVHGTFMYIFVIVFDLCNTQPIWMKFTFFHGKCYW